MTTDYKPIDCNFHDILLDRATRRKVVAISFYSEENIKTISGIITDVYSKSGAEYLTVNQMQIRLDKLISVDDIKLNSFCKI